MSTIVQVVAARPNFVKMAPVIAATSRLPGVEQIVVHTGQHYDGRMSAEMLEDLRLPKPDVFLGVGSGTHAEQTGRALIAFEATLMDNDVDLVTVAGDVNSTLACALAAAKLGIPVAHVEAGLRSSDWTMPEEVNRVLTDRLSALLLTHSPEAADNLVSEGIAPSRIHHVGNTMIDSLTTYASDARDRAVWRRFGLAERSYVLITLHRPSNVDAPGRLDEIVQALCRLAERSPLVFPVHPRTRARLAESGGVDALERAGARLLDPLGYLDFLSLEQAAGAVLTDSGGIQEETSALGVPCFTLRANTERPVTLSHGTNVLLGDDPSAIAEVSVSNRPPAPCAIPLWDGHAADRVAELLSAAVGATAAADDPLDVASGR